MISGHTKFIQKRRREKSQQCEATAGLRGLARDAGSQPREKNLRILHIFDSLEKSSGNLQVFKRTQGAQWTPWPEVGNRRSEWKVQIVRKVGGCDWSGCENRWRCGEVWRPGKNPRGIRVFSRPPPDRQVAVWERPRFAVRLTYATDNQLRRKSVRNVRNDSVRFPASFSCDGSAKLARNGKGLSENLNRRPSVGMAARSGDRPQPCFRIGSKSFGGFLIASAFGGDRKERLVGQVSK
jgi:hypothetical protein